MNVRKKYAEKDVLIVSISLDEDSKVVPPFVEKMKMTYPVFVADREVARAFKISQIPHNAFYSKDGQLILSEPGMNSLTHCCASSVCAIWAQPCDPGCSPSLRSSI